MSNSNLDQSYSTNKEINKNERFAKLSEKISQIQVTTTQIINKTQNVEIHNPNKISKLEEKLNDMEENLTGNINTLEMKYSLLKEQLAKFTKIIEEDKAAKQKIKTKTTEELKQLENRIKTLITEEREVKKI